MSDFEATLDRLGLSEYASVFIAEGFDSWETLLDIQESDLEALSVKLGHRRKLQRAIAESKQDHPLPSLSQQSSNASGKESLGKSTPESSDQPAVRPKRRYKRHPKPDPDAPERPVSAYVLFSNDVRERMKNDGQELNFCDMAKIIGEQWQNLPVEERESYEEHAAAKKLQFNRELAEYKKTEQWRNYQRYLAEFKANHKDTAASPDFVSAEPKRSKLLHETSNPERNGSLSSTERSLSSYQGSMASPSAQSAHSDSNARPEFPSHPTSPGHDYYAPPKRSPTAHSGSNSSHSRDQPTPVLKPAAYVAADLANPYTRRRSSSYTLGLSLPPTAISSRPLLATQEPSVMPPLPPMRTSNDPAMTLRSLPPPIPSLGKHHSMTSDPIPVARKQDPMDALIAAAESQAPRLAMPTDSPR